MSKFQPENTAALRNGNRTKRGGIVLAELGKRYSTIYNSLKDLRRALEKRVLADCGSIDFGAAAKINEALRWEMTARVTQRLIADTPAMTPSETISALNTIGNATRNRNAIMSKLLDGKSAAAVANDPWQAIDNPPPAAVEIPPIPPPAERNEKISTSQNSPVPGNSVPYNKDFVL